MVLVRGGKLFKLYWTKNLVVKDYVNVVDMEERLWYKGLTISTKNG